MRAYAIKNTIDGSYVDENMLPTFNRGDRKLFAKEKDAKKFMNSYLDVVEKELDENGYFETIESTLIVQTDEILIGKP